MSVFPENGTTPMELLQQADGAMYAAKRMGKNRLMAFSEELGGIDSRASEPGKRSCAMPSRGRNTRVLSAGIRRGDRKAGALRGAGALDSPDPRFRLARQVHPDRGETGLISALGHQMMEMACREAVEWQAIAGAACR